MYPKMVPKERTSPADNKVWNKYVQTKKEKRGFMPKYI